MENRDANDALEPSMNEALHPWLVHIDVSPRSVVIEAEQILHLLVAQHDSQRYGPPPVVLRQIVRPNHFEIIGRQKSLVPFDDYRSSPELTRARWALGSMLASPFDARLYDEPRDGQWPTAQNGDFVVLTQVELHSEHVRAGSELLHAYVDAQTSQVGLVGQALLQRLHRVGLFEVISVWEAQELFDEFLNSSVGQGLRLSLDPVLSTPLEDRRHQMIIGEWSVSTSE